MKNVIILLIAAFFCLASTSVRADDRATAVALVKKAVAFYQANGAEKLIEEASNPKGQFVEGASYVFVMDKDAFMLAHPMNASIAGTATMKLQDANGKFFCKEMVEVASSKGAWVDYISFKNPKTNEMAPKSTYVERIDDFIVGSGIYRK